MSITIKTYECMSCSMIFHASAKIKPRRCAFCRSEILHDISEDVMVRCDYTPVCPLLLARKCPHHEHHAFDRRCCDHVCPAGFNNRCF